MHKSLIAPRPQRMHLLDLELAVHRRKDLSPVLRRALPAVVQGVHGEVGDSVSQRQKPISTFERCT